MAYVMGERSGWWCVADGRSSDAVLTELRWRAMGDGRWPGGGKEETGDVGGRAYR